MKNNTLIPLMAISYQGAVKKVSGEILSKYEVVKIKLGNSAKPQFAWYL